MNSTRPIRLHIERLVLEGVPCAPADGPALEAALGAELAQWAGGHLPARLNGGAFAKLDAPVIHLTAASSPELLGGQIARALGRALGFPAPHSAGPTDLARSNNQPSKGHHL